jgi:hypothetical protein
MRFHHSTRNGSFFTKHLSYVSRLGAGLTLALAIGTPLAAAGPNVTAAPAAVESSVNWYAPDRVNTLLRDLREINTRLDRNGQTLDSFTRSARLSWQSHAAYLSMMRADINKSGQIIREMQDIQSGALPWQKEAIGRVHPIGLELAQHTEAAISHLNENQRQLFVPAYTERLAAISDSAEKLRSTVNQFLDYGDAQAKSQTLAQTLEIADS